MQVRDTVFYTKQVGKTGDIVVEKVVVLEYSQHAHIGNNAHDKKLFSCLFIGLVLEKYACNVVYYNGERQYKNILRLEEHVKETGCGKQQEPPRPMRQ